MLILTPERLQRLGMWASPAPASSPEVRLPAEAPPQSALVTPSALRSLPAPPPRGFRCPGDAVLLVGIAAPGLRKPAQREAFDHALLELVERDFVRSAAAATFAGLRAAVEASGLSLRWNRDALEDACATLQVDGPLAMISCLSRAHLAVAGCVERHKAVAAVTLGHVV